MAAEVTAHYLVVGVPFGLDGSEGRAAAAIRSEIRGLRKRILREGLDLEVAERDERFTTVEAHRGLDAAGLHGVERRELIDASAAAILLQAWLEAGGGEPS